MLVDVLFSTEGLLITCVLNSPFAILLKDAEASSSGRTINAVEFWMPSIVIIRPVIGPSASICALPHAGPLAVLGTDCPAPPSMGSSANGRQLTMELAGSA